MQEMQEKAETPYIRRQIGLLDRISSLPIALVQYHIFPFFNYHEIRLVMALVSYEWAVAIRRSNSISKTVCSKNDNGNHHTQLHIHCRAVIKCSTGNHSCNRDGCYLDLSQCYMMHSHLQFLLVQSRLLTSLSLHSVRGVCDEDMRTIAAMPVLRFLSLKQLPAVHDESLHDSVSSMSLQAFEVLLIIFIS